MADKKMLDAIELGDLILLVDTGRAPDDAFKLPAGLRALLEARLTAAKGKNSAVAMNEGSEAGADIQRAEALRRLAGLLRNGYAYIMSVPEEDLPLADRQRALESYGWENGLLGDLETPARVESLARQAPVAGAEISIPSIAKYPLALMTRISNWLQVLESTQALSLGGTHQTMVEQRNDARDLLQAATSRVRHFYCSASDDGEYTTQLAVINMQPKRAPGEAQPQPGPDAAGTATYNAATRELSVEALPAHATFLRAYRQAPGGDPELAGVSTTPTVSIVGYSPLVTGVQYTVWVVGANSQSEGAPSNQIVVTG